MISNKYSKLNCMFII